MAASVNPLDRLRAARRCALNGWIASPAPITAQAMAAAGWDALTVDLQHGTADYADLLSLFPIFEGRGVAPMVRVPWLDEAIIMRVLDAGALGVIAPMIETAEQARRLVAACRYPPEGTRSFGPVRARLSWPGDFSPASANASVLVFAMIETRAGVAALDEIVSVPGLSGIYIGPADLALSHGHTPRFDPEERQLLDIICGIRRRTAGAGLWCGLHCGTPDYALQAAREGMDLVTIGSDLRFVESGAAAAVAAFRQDQQG